MIKFLLIYLLLNTVAMAQSEQGKIDIFLVRGLIRSIEYSQVSNEELQGALRQRLGSDLILHSFELAGNGRLYQEDSPTSIKQMIEQLKLQYKKYKRDDATPYLIAISLGGMIGINWLDLYPGDYQKGFIFNSSLPKFCGLFERLLPKNIPNFLAATLSWDAEYKEKKIFSIIINHTEKNKDIWKSWAKVSEKMPVSFANTLRQTWAAMTAPNPEKVKVPLYIAVSENDRMVSSNCSKRMAKAWEVPLFIHPTAGHDILNDDPKWMAEIIANNL